MFTSHFLYRVGGGLTWNDPTYVERTADSELHQALLKGQFSYVLGPHQMGKSSLRIRTRYRLAQQGYRCVTIQANQLMDYPILKQSKWCAALISTIWVELNLGDSASLMAWLATTAHLASRQRLDAFVAEHLINTLQNRPIAIFIDEIDALIGTACQVELFDWIERCYTLRRIAKAYQNLQFAIFGRAVAADVFPSSLPAADSTTAPDSLADTADSSPNGLPNSLLEAEGRAIELRPFTLIETYGLHQGFEGKISQPTTLLKAIYRWTHGQPFLTQKLCSIAAELVGSLVQTSEQPIVLSSQTINDWIDQLVRSHILQDWRTKDNPMHLRAIFDTLMTSPLRTSLLSLYQKVLTGSPAHSSIIRQNRLQEDLLLTGIVIVKNNRLQVANEIYRQVFSFSRQSSATAYHCAALI